jgi:Protein of unknown function (DUF3363)
LSISRRTDSPVARGRASSLGATSSKRCGARELDAVGARLSNEIGMPYAPPAAGELVAGTFRKRLTLSSSRFAMIDNDLGFALVPWTPALDRHLGHRFLAASRFLASRSSSVKSAFRSPARDCVRNSTRSRRSPWRRRRHAAAADWPDDDLAASVQSREPRPSSLSE